MVNTVSMANYAKTGECCYCIDDVRDTVKKDFENTKVQVAIENDKILRVCYGDYMKLPKIEERGAHHNIFEPKSINGGEAKYSVSCLIPKEDKKTLLAIHKAVEAAKEDGKTRKWGGKIPPTLKLPLRDGDIDRPDDENYQEHFFVNASSKDAPQVVDRHVQPVTDPMMVYSGCYCNVSVNFYAFNANGNRGVAAGLGNVQFVKDGDRLSGKASAESDFDALDDEDVLGGDAGEELPDYLR